MKLAVIGCGYVGLVSGSCLAEAGHEVVAADSDSARIAALQDGKIPIYEPHLDKVLDSVVREGRLRFTANGAEAVREADVVFICVGTPPTETGEADLTAIDSVARMIAKESRTPNWSSRRARFPRKRGSSSSGHWRSTRRIAEPNFALRRIPSSCGKAPRWRIFFIPTASSSESRKRKARPSCASCTGRSLRGSFAARSIS